MAMSLINVLSRIIGQVIIIPHLDGPECLICQKDTAIRIVAAMPIRTESQIWKLVLKVLNIVRFIVGFQITKKYLSVKCAEPRPRRCLEGLDDVTGVLVVCLLGEAEEPGPPDQLDLLVTLNLPPLGIGLLHQLREEGVRVGLPDASALAMGAASAVRKRKLLTINQEL